MFVADGVTLGRNVKVQNNVSLYGGVVCEDDVFLGPFRGVHKRQKPALGRAPQRSRPLPDHLPGAGRQHRGQRYRCVGTRLGRYAFVGAGSVVTKDVPAYALVYGTPARQQGWMSAYGHRLTFRRKAGQATCPESGEKYELNALRVDR